jgi:type I restriction enzyme S subunit
MEFVRIGSLGRVVTGRTPPSAQPEWFGSLYPFLTPSDMDDDARHVATSRFLSEAGSTALSRVLLPANAVCCVCIGATIGKVCMSDQPTVTNQQINSIVVDPNRHDPYFIYYVLRTLGSALKQRAGGAATPIINKSQFEDVELQLPDLETQRRAGQFLSTYDDLIENNARRIAILEEMSRRIYEQWFVHFRVSDYKELQLVNSPLGSIPQGWEVKTLKDITTKIGSGATPKGGKESYGISGINLIRSQNVYDYKFDYDGLAFINEAQAAQLDNVTLEKGDVLLNITGASVARCCLLPSDMLPGRVNQHVAIVRANRDLAQPSFIHDAMNERMNKQRLLAIAYGGATREALTKETLENFPITFAPPDIMARHASLVHPIHELREVLARGIRNLRVQRDLLLPKLISGEIDVSEAEELMEAAE